MIRRLFDRARFRPGQLYTGPVAYADEDGSRRLPLAYYALSADGKELRRPLLRLVAIDDAPGDPEDGAFHYEIASAGDPPSKPGRSVALEAVLEGRGSLEGPDDEEEEAEEVELVEPMSEPEPYTGPLCGYAWSVGERDSCGGIRRHGFSRLLCSHRNRSMTVPAMGVWHHIVGVADGTNIYLYVDGIQKGSAAAGATYTGYTVNNLFAHSTPGTGQYLNCRLAHVAYYNRALPASAIARHYLAASDRTRVLLGGKL